MRASLSDAGMASLSSTTQRVTHTWSKPPATTTLTSGVRPPYRSSAVATHPWFVQSSTGSAWLPSSSTESATNETRSSTCSASARGLQHDADTAQGATPQTGGSALGASSEIHGVPQLGRVVHTYGPASARHAPRARPCAGEKEEED